MRLLPSYILQIQDKYFVLYFSHLTVCQYIDHDLSRKTERTDEGLTIGEHIDLPLGGHVVLEHFLLLFGEGVGQRVPGSHNFVQRLGVLAVALEAALAGANIAEVKIFQNQHLDTSISSIRVR